MNAVATSTRLTADERREEIVAAAMSEFARHGLGGASVLEIADRAGVSQPYVYQLFGTKKDLFLAVIHEGFARVWRAFEDAANRQVAGSVAGCNSVLEAMARRYMELLTDRTLLLVQLQGYAACDDADCRAVVRREWDVLHQAVTRVSGATPTEIHEFFAKGMLLNVAAAIGPDGEPFNWTFEQHGERQSTT
jgi:AcrR family transcriptional regulator